MDSRVRIVCSLLFAVSLAGCEGAIVRDCRLSPTDKSFVLGEPYEFIDSAGAGATCLLAAGVYQCYYIDQCGDYYEAPFTTKKEYFFSGNRRGGVYVTRGELSECRIYTQDNRITHYYSSYGGSSQYGGSGKYVVTTRLPDDFLAIAKFSDADTGKSGNENNPR